MMGQKGDLQDLIKQYRLKRELDKKLNKEDVVWVYKPLTGYKIRPKNKPREDVITVSKLTIYLDQFIQNLLKRKAKKKETIRKEYEGRIDAKKKAINVPKEVKTTDKLKETRREIEMLQDQLKILQAREEIEFEEELKRIRGMDEEELEKEVGKSL